MAKVAVFTLGCKVNQAESEGLKLSLSMAGHEVVEDASQTDLCVVNTCTVTEESDRKCRKLLRRLWRDGARAIAAAGCYVQINQASLRDMSGVVALIPNSSKSGWEKEIISMLPPPEGDGAFGFASRSRGFVKAQDGCERGCSYCIVPRARGAEVSVPPHTVVEDVTRWRGQGSEEIVICGVNLGRYRYGDNYDLASLVKEVLQKETGFRLRLSSLEPEDLRLRWVEEWSSSSRVCPHLHLPLQSGDEAVLRDMGRDYTPEDFLGAVSELRKMWPCAAVTTEVMVGYPGEGERAFANTVKTLEAIRPARVHVFRFSPRPGTRAWGRRDTVDQVTAEKRSKQLRTMAERWRCAYVEEHLGETRGFLVEKVSAGRNGMIAWGTTEDYIKGALPEPPPGTKTGKIIPARIIGLRRGVAIMKPLSSSIGG